MKKSHNQRSSFYFASPLLVCLFFFFISISIGCMKNENGFTQETYFRCSKLAPPNDMKCIEGGYFIRGSDRISVDEDTWKKVTDESPVAKIFLSTFFMDTYEVTYSQYQECVKAGACSPAGPNYIGFNNPKQPIVGVNWYQARDYCKWKGKRLPSEAEWEKTARGPNGELYPWGNEKIDCSKAVIKENGKTGCGTEKTQDVGSKGAFRYGLYDIAGNSWEWANDWYSENYNKCGSDCSDADPKGPCKGNDNCPGYSRRVVRGGSWWWEGEHALGSNRRGHFPKNKPFHHLGFRCARSPER